MRIAESSVGHGLHVSTGKGGGICLLQVVGKGDGDERVQFPLTEDEAAALRGVLDHFLGSVVSARCACGG